MPLRLRPYEPSDAEATLALFRRAVHTTASADYTPVQLNAWAPADADPAAWASRRAVRRTVVAELDGRVVGFTDVDADGYIDMMYVDPSAGGRGVGSALLAWALEEAANEGAVAASTHASITARPFFEAHGFTVDEVRHPVRGGVTFVNYGMSRSIASPRSHPMT